MIRGIARLAVANPVSANLAMAAILVCGAVVYRGMPREVFPDFSLDRVEIMTFYPGAAPEDVERLVTTPLEEAVERVDGVDEVVSSSREGLSRITLTLDAGAELTRVMEETRDAVNRGDVELPEEAEEPWVQELRTIFPVISVFVYGWASQPVLRELAEEHKRGIEAIAGIRDAFLTGSHEPRLWIEVDPEALERYELSLADVGRAVAAKAKDSPLGSLTTEQGDWLLRVDSELEWAADLADLPLIATPDGRLVRLSAVARLSDTFEREVTRARFNGQPCMHMQVNKTSDGDIITLAAKVRAYVEEQRPAMPPGTTLGTNADLSIYVQNRLQVMKQSGSLGAFLVLAALLLFLEPRVAFVTALGIPVAFLGGLMLGGTFGVTLNMITMFSMIVVLGMIVDDAIVVGENVYRRMEEGEDPALAAVEGTAEVGKPVIATILTSVAAFLPILMMEGTMGLFLRPLPLIVSFCLLVSVFEALVILPAHMAHWIPRGAARRMHGGGERRRWYEGLRRAYLRLLGLCLRWRYVTLVAALSAAVVLVSVATHWIPFVYFDDFESKLFYVNLRLEPGTSLQETERVAREVERAALELPESELESVNTLIGVSASDVSSYEMAHNLAQVWVELREGPSRRMLMAEIIETLRQGLSELPANVESVEFGQPQSGPNGRAIEISVRGPELAQLRAISEELTTALEGYAGTRDVHDNLDEGKSEVLINLTDHGRTLGFTEAGLGAELRAAFEGTTWGHVRRGPDDVELVVKLPEEVRERRSALERLRVSAPSGERVPLSAVAQLSDGVGPSVITHDQRLRSVKVVADVNKAEGNAQDIVADLGQRYADLSQRWPGYALAFQGDAEETQRSLDGLASAAIVSLALIYLILGSLFRSFTQPVVIMFIVPFAASGVILGHLLMDRAITMMSLIGLLALAGVVVNDALIFVDFVNRRRAAGSGLVPSLLDAGRLRFRPILLTSLTTMLGLAPLTFFATGQARFLQPMAISLFFGLALATVLVLVLVPCAYAVLEDVLAWVSRPRATYARMRRREALHA